MDSRPCEIVRKIEGVRPPPPEASLTVSGLIGWPRLHSSGSDPRISISIWSNEQGAESNKLIEIMRMGDVNIIAVWLD